MGILNQLSIVFGLLLGQSLAFPFAKAFTWRYTMVVAVGVAAVQFAGGFMAKEARKGENLRRSVRNAEEEAPLLAAAEEPPLNLKGVLVSQDKLVRRGCKL